MGKHKKHLYETKTAYTKTTKHITQIHTHHIKSICHKTQYNVFYDIDDDG